VSPHPSAGVTMNRSSRMLRGHRPSCAGKYHRRSVGPRVSGVESGDDASAHRVAYLRLGVRGGPRHDPVGSPRSGAGSCFRGFPVGPHAVGGEPPAPPPVPPPPLYKPLKSTKPGSEISFFPCNSSLCSDVCQTQRPLKVGLL